MTLVSRMTNLSSLPTTGQQPYLSYLPTTGRHVRLFFQLKRWNVSFELFRLFIHREFYDIYRNWTSWMMKLVFNHLTSSPTFIKLASFMDAFHDLKVNLNTNDLFQMSVQDSQLVMLSWWTGIAHNTVKVERITNRSTNRNKIVNDWNSQRKRAYECTPCRGIVPNNNMREAAHSNILPHAVVLNQYNGHIRFSVLNIEYCRTPDEEDGI